MPLKNLKLKAVKKSLCSERMNIQLTKYPKKMNKGSRKKSMN